VKLVSLTVSLVAAGLLFGCAGGSSGSYPNGTVKTPQDAIAIAEKECGPPLQDGGAWRARLDKDVWFVWRTPHAYPQIAVDARDGKTLGCVLAP
jgi:hypothetical protein